MQFSLCKTLLEPHNDNYHRFHYRVCVCVSPPPRLLITSGVMWRDMDPIIRLVKQFLELLYSCYPIMGVALALIRVVDTNP